MFLAKTIEWKERRKGRKLRKKNTPYHISATFVSCCCEIVYPIRVDFYDIFLNAHHTSIWQRAQPHECFMIASKGCLQHLPKDRATPSVRKTLAKAQEEASVSLCFSPKTGCLNKSEELPP